MGKELHYFTFGAGQEQEGFCQPILAENAVEAREIMVEVYGSQWAFQYTEEQYQKYKEEGTLTEKLLKPIE